jgi:hypothetical protein
MTQEQEFEFRARAEAERAAATAPEVSAVDVVGKKGIGHEPFLRSAAKGLGGILGAAGGTVLGAGETAATAGFGLPAGVATAMAGGTLGYGAGGQLYDLIANLKNYRKPNFKPDSAVGNAANDLSEGVMGELGGGIVGAAAAPVIRRGVPLVSKLMKAGPTATSAVNDVRAQALANVLKQKMVARSLDQTASSQAQAAQAAQQAAQATAESAKPINVGLVSHLTEMGAPGQEAAMANAAAAKQAERAAYDAHTAAIDDVVKAGEANGVYVNDLPETKTTLKKAQDMLSPNPVTASTTAPRPTTGEQRAYKMVQDALTENKVPLTAAQAEKAQNLGYKVDVSGGGGTEANPIPETYFRTFKTPLEAVTNLRRFAGDAGFSKDAVSGFEGVASSTWKGIYKDLSGIEDAATQGLSQAQKDAYKAALANSEKFSTGIGKNITSVQGINETPKLPAAKIPGKVIGGGADTYEQFKAITDPQIARKFANDAVETALHDPVARGALGYDAAAKKVAKGTPLGDMIHAIPDLETSVNRHLNGLLDAKNAGVAATDFGKTATESSAAQAAARKDRLYYQSQAINLKNLPDKDVIPAAKGLIKKLAEENKITAKQQDQYVKQINEASKAVGFKNHRDIAIKTVLGAIGAYEAAKLTGNVMKLGE